MVDLASICRSLVKAGQTSMASTNIKHLLLDGRALQDIFDNAAPVKHVLGFTQVQIGELDGVAVRLHIWPLPSGDISDDTSDIHSHPWPLRSFVLAGSVINSIYDVQRSATGPGELYEVRRTSGSVIHTKLYSTVHWNEREQKTITGGEDYAVCMSDFHSSTLGPSGAVTLALAGPRGNKFGRVIKEKDSPRLVKRFPVYASRSDGDLVLDRAIRMLMGETL